MTKFFKTPEKKLYLHVAPLWALSAQICKKNEFSSKKSLRQFLNIIRKK